MELQVTLEYEHGLWFVSVKEAGHLTEQVTKHRRPGYSIFEKAVQAAIDYAEAEDLPIESWDLMNSKREVCQERGDLVL